jgi:predicted N-acetyltransferase YhbS
MRRSLGEGLELDDDPRRIDIAAVHRFIAQESYWARGRDYALQERLVREASRVVGLYDEQAQIGFCRAVTCSGLPFVYLADVYVLDAYRGRGLGIELVREMVERGRYRDEAWILQTGDAHGLYRRFGFEAPGWRTMVRPPAGRPVAPGEGARPARAGGGEAPGPA